MRVTHHQLGTAANSVVGTAIRVLAISCIAWVGLLGYYHHNAVVKEISAEVRKEHRDAQWVTDRCNETRDRLARLHELRSRQQPTRAELDELVDLQSQDLVAPVRTCADAALVLERDVDYEVTHKVLEEYESHVPFVTHCRTHDTCQLLMVQVVSSITNSMTLMALAFAGGVVAMYLVIRALQRGQQDIATVKAAARMTVPLAHEKHV